jgi:ferredoxin
MSAELYFNNIKSIVSPGSQMHEYGESMGIRVPTSCNRQGKCKECIVEVTEGMELLSSPTEKESHLKDNFRLSCQCKIITDSGVIRCNTKGKSEDREKSFTSFRL